MTGRFVRVGVFLAVVLTTVPLAFGGKPLVVEPSSGDTPAWAAAVNYGKVAMLYPGPGGVHFQFFAGKTAMQPKGGYYYLPASHPNYQPMFDLLYGAAEKRWTLMSNTDPKLNADGLAVATGFVVYFTK